jgi:hypothetical protein
VPEIRLTSIHIYPMKAARAVDLGESKVEPWGLADDRRWMLADQDGRFYLIPDAGGLIRVGDPVAILDAALPAEPYRFSRDTIAERSAAAGSSGSPIERQPMCLSGRTSSAPSSAISRIRAQS